MSSSTGVVVASVIGSGLVLALVVRVREGRRPSRLEIPAGSSWLQRLARVTGRASAVLMAGLVSGVLVLGLGLRLMMRIAAVTSPQSAQGRITDAEEVVGEVTLGGTLFLVLGVGTLAGVAAASVWVAMRRWLPERSVLAGVTLAALGAGVFARPSGLIDPENRDFVILSPAWLAVLLSILVVLAFSVSFMVLADRWAATWPDPAPTFRGALPVMPFLVVLALSVPIIVPAVVMVAAVSVAAFRRRTAGRTMRWLDLSERPGSLALGVGAAVGAVWLGVSVVQVLAL